MICTLWSYQQGQMSSSFVPVELVMISFVFGICILQETLTTQILGRKFFCDIGALAIILF